LRGSLRDRLRLLRKWRCSMCAFLTCCQQALAPKYRTELLQHA
jgi:hypothetical protein